MSTDLDASFNEQFMNINMRLKKRFMRKPNLAECAKEFIALGVRAEYSEQPSFAGHAYVGAAKCAASAGDNMEEAQYYLVAAMHFLKAEKKLRTMNFHSPNRENLEAAIGCFITAFNKYPEKSLIKGSVIMRLAYYLDARGYKEDALFFYDQAAENVKQVPLKQICYRIRVDLEIDCGKYDQALRTANLMADADYSPDTMPEFELLEIQINRILLTLLAKPLNDDEPPSLKQLFADLMNDTESDKIPFNPNLKLKMQSIISSCMSGDVEALVAVAAEAAPHLAPPQYNMLQQLITRERADHLALT